MATIRLYTRDDHCLEAVATVVAVRDDAIACDQTCLYPGGGGQPPDHGRLMLASGTVLPITSVRADADGVVWHLSDAEPIPDVVGQQVRLFVDEERRHALSRYHTVLHVLNTVALRDYGGWITGTQIATDYGRIDFNLAGLSAELCSELEAKVNAVLAMNRAVSAHSISEEEFATRDDLRRTLTAQPLVVDGRVRVVAIEGFDEQACGGTHVRTTAEVGVLSIVRTENKGRLNKRLYVRLL